MKIKISAYGIARDILKSSSMDFETPDNARIENIKALLIESYPDFRGIHNIRFAVNDEYEEDDFQLQEGDELIIIPPVSGG